MRTPVSLSFTSPHTTAETIADIISTDGLLYNTFTFPGTDETFRQKGGYVWTVNRSLADARTAVAQLQHPLVINLNVSFLVDIIMTL
jgi:hypothetical protein